MSTPVDISPANNRRDNVQQLFFGEMGFQIEKTDGSD